MQKHEDWMDEWLIIDSEGWKLKDGAPTEVQVAFNKYMEEN